VKSTEIVFLRDLQDRPISRQGCRIDRYFRILATTCTLLLGVVSETRAQTVSDGQALFENKGCNGGGCHGTGVDLRHVRNAANFPGAIARVFTTPSTSTLPNISKMIAAFDNDPDTATPSPPNSAEQDSLALYIGQFLAPTPRDRELSLSGCNRGSFNVSDELLPQIPSTASGTAPDSGGITISTQGAKGIATSSGHTIIYEPGPDLSATGDVFRYTVTNLAGTSSPAKVDVRVIGDRPSIGLSNQFPVLNQPVTYDINATNHPIKTYSIEGSLPPGLGRTNDKISGTPTESGSFLVQVSATNCLGAGEKKQVTFSVAPNQAPDISQTSFEGTVGQPFSQDIKPSSPPILAFEAPNPPPGLSLRMVNDTTATIAGTPTQSGKFENVVLRATNKIGSTEKLVTITIFPTQTPGISTDPEVLSGVWNQPFTAKILATNPPIEGYEGSGLPTGLTVNTSTGEITGTPTVPGEFIKATLTVRNRAGPTTKGPFKFSIVALAPTAQDISMLVRLNNATTIDLASQISGHGVKGVTIDKDKAPRHGAVTVNGTLLTYTPRRDYFGPDSFAFIALGTGGTSTPARVTVTVEGRPDPSKDSDVLGLIGAQTDSARRFSRAQIFNFQGRLDALHRQRAGEADSRTDKYIKPSGSTPQEQPLVEPRSVGQPAAANLASQFYNATAMAGAYSQVDKGSLMSLVIASALGDQTSSGLSRGVFGTLLGLSRNGSLDLSSLNFTSDTAAGSNTGFWAAGNIGFGDRDASSKQSGMKFRTSGISLGVDRRYSNRFVLGVGLGYARDRTEIGIDGTESQARATTLSLYGSYQQPNRNVFIDGLIGYGALDYDTKRFVEPLTEVVTDPNEQPVKHFAQANRDGNLLFGSLAVGYESPREQGFLWSPYARLDVSRNQLDKATETGAEQFNLTYLQQNITNAELSVGLRTQWEHELKHGGVALPHARLEYTRNLKGDERASIAYADLINGPRYTVPSVTGDRNALTLGIGSDFVLCNGANFGIDYQFRHSSGQEHSQGLQFRLAKELGAQSRPCKASDDAAPPNRRITVDAAFTYDNNVTRARDNAGPLADESFSLKGTKELELFKFGRLGFVVSGSLGGEAFRRFSDLGHIFGEAQAELRYPAYSPNVAVFARGAVDHYKSQIRRGYNYSAGVVVQRNFAQRGIALTAQLAHNARHGESSVFDLSDNSAQLGVSYALNKDLSTGKTDVLYLSGEYRLGDVVSTERESLANLNIADVFVLDDAFGRSDLFSYRFDARTTALSIGYIKPIGSGHLDLSWTYARSTPTESSFAGAGSERYVDNQFKLVYVLHFGTWNRMGRFRAY
jgi:outer membrane autotransporter protein